MYLAIARKWRPSRFEDLVGQGHVVQTLKNAIAFNRVSHAYLFSGARGVGKTSVARIFAMALRCPQAQGGVPCNTCTECVAIRESRSVDVVEIDGASNNGVESVRSIRENVVYAPSSGTYKVYIIDEVHMLSLSAFNALLKTLEEPPDHVIFLMATTESQKIPVTILSRCQRFEFRRLTQTQVSERLKHILQEEKMAMTDEGVRVLAAYGDGSLRDSLSLLDQVLSYYSQGTPEALGEKQVVEALGLSDTNTVLAFLGAVLRKDTSAFLDLLGRSYDSGIDLKRFAERCLEELRLVFLMILAKEAGKTLTADELDVSSSHLQGLSELSQTVSLLQIERMSQILGKTISQLAWATLPRYVLEMAAVRMSRLDALEQVEKALLSGEPLTVAAPPAAPIATVASAPAPTPVPRPAPAMAMPTGNKSWQGFVDSVMKKRPLLGALLCHGEFRLNGKAARLTFAEGSFYERQSRDPKNREEIETFIKAYFGADLQLELSTGQGDRLQTIEGAKQAEAAQWKQQALEHPAVAKMKEVLGAEVVGVDVEV